MHDFVISMEISIFKDHVVFHYMRRFSRLIQIFFGLSRSQTNGFIVLLPVMAVIIFSEPVYRWWVINREADYSRDVMFLDSVISLWQVEQNVGDSMAKPHEYDVFDFDPNRALVEELQSLGFSVSLSKRIINYRDKGGKFRTKSDVLKMYGMDTVLYRRLYNHILLPTTIQKEGAAKSEIKFEDKPKTIARFNINTADSIQLEEIYGIGPKLSKRIITYREKLGGFISIHQLNEVWGLDTTIVNSLAKRSFVAQKYLPVQLNINQATENELSAHPYLSHKSAKAIVAYRFQHGAFTRIEDLGNIQALDINTIQKITPYLKLQN
jgi:competence protein ComEA